MNEREEEVDHMNVLINIQNMTSEARKKCLINIGKDKKLPDIDVNLELMNLYQNYQQQNEEQVLKSFRILTYYACCQNFAEIDVFKRYNVADMIITLLQCKNEELRNNILDFITSISYYESSALMKYFIDSNLFSYILFQVNINSPYNLQKSCNCLQNILIDFPHLITKFSNYDDGIENFFINILSMEIDIQCQKKALKIINIMFVSTIVPYDHKLLLINQCIRIFLNDGYCSLITEILDIFFTFINDINTYNIIFRDNDVFSKMNELILLNNDLSKAKAILCVCKCFLYSSENIPINYSGIFNSCMSDSQYLKYVSIWALTNMISASKDILDLYDKMGLCTVIGCLIEHCSLECKKALIQLISTIIKNANDELVMKYCENGCISFIVSFLDTDIYEVIEADCLVPLVHLFKNKNKYIRYRCWELFNELNGPQLIDALMQSENEQISKRISFFQMNILRPMINSMELEI